MHMTLDRPTPSAAQIKADEAISGTLILDHLERYADVLLIPHYQSRGTFGCTLVCDQASIGDIHGIRVRTIEEAIALGKRYMDFLEMPANAEGYKAEQAFWNAATENIIRGGLTLNV